MERQTSGMELTDDESLERLMALVNKKRPRRKPGLGPALISASRSPRKRCSCGECTRCRDNARWDRIYAEKFADPNYYGLRTVQMSSTLKGW